MLNKFCFPVLSTMVMLGIAASPAIGQSPYGPSQSQKGAVAGGIAGAILGGIAGHQNDETPEGVALGGVVGAIAGGLLGKSQDNQMQRQYQYRQTQHVRQAEQMRRAVSLNDAISMSRSGLTPNLIVSQIRSSGVQQEIGVKEVILLHENGVPEVVIQAMQRAPVGGVAPTIVVDRTPVFVTPRPRVIVETHRDVYHDYHHGFHHDVHHDYHHDVPHNAHFHFGYHR